MLKYQLAAAALKMFSINGVTKQAYRGLGNRIGGKSRQKAIKPGYVARADGNLAFIESNAGIADGQTVLELGTGWVHWEALFTRLFYEVELIVFDIWDNRQFAGFIGHARALKAELPSLTHRGESALAKAEALLDRVLECGDFEEAYKLLGFTYVLDAKGDVGSIATDSVDLVISSDVMEHIPETGLPELAKSLRRIVRDGSHINQQIVEADHLCIYDRTVHPKNYLRYSNASWKLRFENDIQYINRWQHSDFVRLFREHGFDIVDEQIVSTADTSRLAIAPRWKDYDRPDLDTTVSRLLVKKHKE